MNRLRQIDAHHLLLTQQHDLRGHTGEHRERAERIQKNVPHDLPPSIFPAVMSSLNESVCDRLNVKAKQTDDEAAPKNRGVDAPAHVPADPRTCMPANGQLRGERIAGRGDSECIREKRAPVWAEYRERQIERLKQPLFCQSEPLSIDYCGHDEYAGANVKAKGSDTRPCAPR